MSLACNFMVQIKNDMSAQFIVVIYTREYKPNHKELKQYNTSTNERI